MSDRLRVALITNYPEDPTQIAGGVQAVSARLVAALCQRNDLELHVIHCHSDILESHVVHDGPATLHFIAQSRRRLIPNMATGVARIAARLREIRPDVVHAHGPSLAFAALQAGYDPLWTIHGVLSQEAPLFQGLFNRLSFALARHYEGRALAKTSIITGVNAYVVDAYRDLPGARSRPIQWEVVENPAADAYFDLVRRPVPGRVFLPAVLIPRKDQLTMVRAIAHARQTIPNLHLHLAGSLAEGDYVAAVRAEVDRLGLGQSVSLVGPLSADQLRAAYSEAEIVALSSRQESAPMSILEAMAAGIPVVSTDVGGVANMIQEGVTGHVTPPGDPAALGETLARILSRPEKAAAMGQAAREVAKSRFHPGRVAGQYVRLYQRLAKLRDG